MKQKIQDLLLVLKNDRRVASAAGFVVVALVIWLIVSADDGGRRRGRIAPPQQASEQGSGAADQYGDLIVAFKNDIDEQKKKQEETTQLLRRTSEDLKSHKGRVTAIFETLVDKFEQLAREVDQLALALKQQAEPPPEEAKRVFEGPDDLENIGEPIKDTVVPPPPEAPPRVSVIVPGDSGPARLLTGVNAPTDGTPYPVVFELTGPISGPDGASLDLGSARVIAAAQGNESDGRAIFRLTQLAMRHPSGRRSVVEIDGWVVGEDGIRGMPGKLIDKLGRLILTTAWVSGLSALGESLDDSNQVVVDRNNSGLSVDQNDLEAATASALTDASNRLGQVLLNRYESLVPVVNIRSGREVAIVFSKPAEIELINDEALLLTASAAVPPGAATAPGAAAPAVAPAAARP